MANKSLTKSEIVDALAVATSLEKKTVTAVLDALPELIQRNVSAGGAGVFVLPGLLKIEAVHKPAVEAHVGPHPFTKVVGPIPAKPASTVLKVKALKGLKDMVK